MITSASRRTMKTLLALLALTLPLMADRELTAGDCYKTSTEVIMVRY